MSQPFNRKRIRIGFLPRYNLGKIHTYKKKFIFPNNEGNNDEINKANINNNINVNNNNDDTLSLSLSSIAVNNDNNDSNFNFPVDIQDYLEHGINTLTKRSYHLVMKNKVDYEKNLIYVQGVHGSYNFYYCFLDNSHNWHIHIQGDNNRKFTLTEMANCVFDVPVVGVEAYAFIRNLMHDDLLFDIKVNKSFNFGPGIHGRPIEELREEIKEYFRMKKQPIQI